MTFAVVGGLALGVRALARWRPVFFRPRCMACRGKLGVAGGGVGTRLDGFGNRYATRWIAYRCTRCNAEFVDEAGKPLVTRETWDTSRQAPMPGARIVD